MRSPGTPHTKNAQRQPKRAATCVVQDRSDSEADESSGADDDADVASAAAGRGRFLDERRHDGPAGTFGDAHQRANQEQLVKSVRDAGEPGQKRKREDRGNENSAAAEAVGERAEK